MTGWSGGEPDPPSRSSERNLTLWLLNPPNPCFTERKRLLPLEPIESARPHRYAARHPRTLGRNGISSGSCESFCADYVHFM